MGIKFSFSPSILSKAYIFNYEYSWKPEDLSVLVQELKEKRIAVLGGEVWQKSDNGPIITSELYNWTAEEKKDNETWDQYSDRTLKLMMEFKKKYLLSQI